MKPNLIFFHTIAFFLTLSLLVPTTGNGQCVTTSAGTSEAHHWPSPNIPGQCTVRVSYVNLMYNQTSAIAGLVDIQATHNYLNARFNEHGIFFEDYHSTVTLSSSDNNNRITYLDAFTPGNSDRIHILIAGDPSVGGYLQLGPHNVTAGPLPSIKCLVTTFSGITQEAFQQVVAHEVGHCLGLFHTHDGEFYAQPHLENAACATTGDLICDTPEDNNLYNKTEYVWLNTFWVQAQTKRAKPRGL